jgi:hypothetical protein
LFFCFLNIRERWENYLVEGRSALYNSTTQSNIDYRDWLFRNEQVGGMVSRCKRTYTTDRRPSVAQKQVESSRRHYSASITK